MSSRISVTIDGRTVHWDILKAHAAAILQILVAQLGPAKED
jgi:hypothetical protein